MFPPVFTYWEGREMPFVNQVCVSSVHRIFGDRHRHMGVEDLQALNIEIPKQVAGAPSKFAKFDYIRAALLHHFGGWWFDCDILLFKAPDPEVEGVACKIWQETPIVACSRFGYEKVNKQWLPLLDVGVLYARKPESAWLTRVLEKCRRKKKLGKHRATVGDLIQNAAYEVNAEGKGPVALGSCYAFYSSTEYWWDWVGMYVFNPENPGRYGVSLYTDAITRGEAMFTNDPYKLSKTILGLKSHAEAVEQFPDSLFARYIKLYC